MSQDCTVFFGDPATFVVYMSHSAYTMLPHSLTSLASFYWPNAVQVADPSTLPHVGSHGDQIAARGGLESGPDGNGEGSASPPADESAGIGPVGGSDRHQLSPTSDQGTEEVLEGQEKEPAPLTPEKCDIVDKDAMDLKLQRTDSKAGNRTSTLHLYWHET